MRRKRLDLPGDNAYYLKNGGGPKAAVISGVRLTGPDFSKPA